MFSAKFCNLSRSGRTSWLSLLAHIISIAREFHYIPRGMYVTRYVSTTSMIKQNPVISSFVIRQFYDPTFSLTERLNDIKQKQLLQTRAFFCKFFIISFADIINEFSVSRWPPCIKDTAKWSVVMKLAKLVPRIMILVKMRFARIYRDISAWNYAREPIETIKPAAKLF